MLSRRDLLRRWLVFALTASGAVDLISACRPAHSQEPEGLPPLTPTAPPTSTLVPAASPTSAATEMPTEAATATLLPPSPTPGLPYLAVARGTNPTAITRAAIDALGGIGRFVKRGDEVILKPNICNAARTMEYATTTNPEVLAALVTLCLDAGAKRVRVMDQPFQGTAREAYRVSGIQAAVEHAGGQMELMSDMKYATTSFPNGRSIKSWQVYQDVLKADVLINVPIAKTHDAAQVTLAMKGLMGVITNRSSIHSALHQRIADLSTVIKPTLNVIDAIRVLARNGPTGGSLDYVVVRNTIIASPDIVAADAYATQLLFSKKPEDIGHIRIGAEMGLGRYDFANLLVKEVAA